MALGVHSAVGKRRKVLIHRPGLGHRRLTPSNAEELLFDDVLWVKKAKEEHDAFAGVMRDVEALAADAGVPVCNGLTDEWHPTQMHADFLTMHEASNKPFDGITYAFVGDCRFNVGRSLLVMGALMGSDARLAGPEELHPPKDVVDLAADIARKHRRADHGDRQPR